MSAARDTIPATGQKAPPKSPELVATMLDVEATDSMTDPSIIILGAWGEVRPLKAAREIVPEIQRENVSGKVEFVMGVELHP